MRDKLRYISIFLTGFLLIYLSVPLISPNICDSCVSSSNCPYFPIDSKSKNESGLDSNDSKICCENNPQNVGENSHQKPTITDQKESRQPFLVAEILKFRPSIQISFHSSDPYTNHTSLADTSEISRAPPSA